MDHYQGEWAHRDQGDYLARRSAWLAAAQLWAPRLARRIGLGALEKLTVRNVSMHVDDTVVWRYDLTYTGLAVTHRQVIATVSTSGEVTIAGLTPHQPTELPTTTPTVTREQAEQAVIAATTDVRDLRLLGTELVVYTWPMPARLAWQTTLSCEAPDPHANAQHVYTDAHTGEIFRRDKLWKSIG